MSFVLVDLGDEEQIQDFLVGSQQQQQQQQQQDTTTTTATFDLVFGLHCCGGVAEAAVELAMTSQSSFCISTCCFRSHEKLASLSRLAEEMILSPKHNKQHHGSENGHGHGHGNTSTPITPQERERQRQQHRQDRDLVTCLATIDNGQGQHCAIRAINAMRLVAAEERVNNQKGDNDTSNSNADTSSSRLKTWQESFPMQYSIQNRVMVGVLVECHND
jgi:hypothetical protein